MARKQIAISVVLICMILILLSIFSYLSMCSSSHVWPLYTSKDGVPYVEGMLRDEDLLIINEILLRGLLASHNHELACFVSYGFNARAQQWTEPPNTLLKYFSYLPFPVFSTKNMIEDHGQIKHASTGKEGCVYTVKVIRQISPKQFIVEAFMHRAPLEGFGHYYYLHKDAGEWEAEGTGEGWVS